MISNLNHKHVIKHIENVESAIMYMQDQSQERVAYIVQEAVLGGTLFDFVKHTGPFSEDVCRYYFKQIIMGVHHIHSKGYSHRDLKTENIMLDLEYDAKIIDFGFASQCLGIDDRIENDSIWGTKEYMAPEMLLRKPFKGESTDVFALGCLLFILCIGTVPFHTASKDDRFYSHFTQYKK